MSLPPPESPRSTLLQRFGDTGALIQIGLLIASLGLGLAAAFATETWGFGVLGGMAAYTALSIAYALLARLCDWPPLRWSRFFAVIFDLLGAF